ncbi:EAL domain-containing protein (putative c-di-GMP-specific phosphodiesterase class I)/GGDEF domain-containing protein [Brevundimonas alba]|uniref:EAL domain-containing protein (Putative c-di-GMP-specific phosphodiesterase class I)/GGDEF domain-containing protein n=1 Tax=Brevundimonas alba TaxID=74314 RepID=A0A7X5YL32_9CAUL|nr:EAL domain-containing protein [Brevundimonas alba]NJC41191.1 EAL domain-containing protein (putative c-di-GMP-specific phosphodiesterase class I)/GGDEF domain-containing protein [Brevundimonas alba]
MPRLPRFNRLRTRLTVLYMGLFGIALLLAAVAIFNAVGSSARKVVRNEMTASGAVYGQIWASRSDQLQQGAAVLARDYGFREAVATGDEATVRSALDNLRSRQGVDGALMLGVDGYAAATGLNLDAPTLDTLFAGLDRDGVEAGVLTIDGQPYQVVAAPVMAPVLIGWVVFAERLDAAQMRNLEGLSAIPLSASVIVGANAAATDRGTAIVPTAEGPSMRLARPLPSLDRATPAALVLTYPLSRALKPYEPLFLSLTIIGIAGIALLMGGTWLLSLSLTRPITALDDAVHGLQRGEYVEAPVTSSDEIGRLASSFNAMVGDLRDREARLTHMALHDQETGLPNRLALERRAGAVAGGWVLLFGVERFEVVRNAIGYDSMARLIGALGRRIEALADGEPVARVGAGVLGLVVEAADADEAVALAERLVGAAQEPVIINGAPVDITVTVGVADRGRSGSDLASPVDRAAIALDQARAAKRHVAAFDPAVYGDPAGNLSLISELMTALRGGEVTLAYQPKYDFRAERVTGVEALMRWTHPRRGFVPPDLFIGMAEETGHIRPLTEWAIDRAIEDQRTLSAAGHDLLVSVNISGRLLADESFADLAIAAVTSAGARLCFEITETAVMTNPETALRIVSRFADAGISISLDDYGSGLSSLAYLKQIRADELKIDKAFILGLDQSARDGLLVKSTIDLAHGLGLKVTAEGVETPTALALLRGMGCDLAQGYLIGRPVSLSAMIERLAEQPQARGKTAVG